MDLFRRVKNILKPPVPLLPEKSLLSIGPGDVVEVSLTTYRVVGKTQNVHRNAILITLEDGNEVRFLFIEERERTTYELYRKIDGRLDSLDEVPTTLELDGTTYYLEESYTGRVQIAGETPFVQAGEQTVWQFQSDDRKLLRIKWQDGRFMLYEGEFIIPAEVQMLRGT